MWNLFPFRDAKFNFINFFSVFNEIHDRYIKINRPGTEEFFIKNLLILWYGEYSLERYQTEIKLGDELYILNVCFNFCPSLWNLFVTFQEPYILHWDGVVKPWQKIRVYLELEFKNDEARNLKCQEFVKILNGEILGGLEDSESSLLKEINKAMLEKYFFFEITGGNGGSGLGMEFRLCYDDIFWLKNVVQMDENLFVNFLLPQKITFEARQNSFI